MAAAALRLPDCAGSSSSTTRVPPRRRCRVRRRTSCRRRCAPTQRRSSARRWRASPCPPRTARSSRSRATAGSSQPFLAAHGARSLIVEGGVDVAAAAEVRGLDVLARPFGARRWPEPSSPMADPVDLVIDNYLLSHLVDPDDCGSRAGRAAQARWAGGPRDGPRAAAPARPAVRLHPPWPRLVPRDGVGHAPAGAPRPLDRRCQYAAGLRRGAAGGGCRDERRPGGDPRGRRHRRSPSDEPGSPTVEAYRAFADGVREVQERLRGFLGSGRARGERVVAYGAPSRGNTLLNASGITSDLLEYTVDRSPLKHGHVLPGQSDPDPRSRANRVDPSRTTCSSSTWDIRDEVMSPAVRGRVVGRPVRGPAAPVRGGRAG